MNCQKAHQQIHLIAELTDQERELLRQHISECEACQQVSESMSFINTVIRRVTNIPIVPSDSSLLTNRIMREIYTQEHTSLNLIERILSYVELGQVKFAMAGISTCLVFILAIEQFRTFPVDSNPSARWEHSASHKTVLHSKRYQDELRKYNSTQRVSLINRCNDPFNITKFNIACYRERIVRLKNL